MHPGWNVTIGPNGSALAYFSVHSKSSSAYYGNLSLQLVGLSIGGTPFSSKLLISPITPFNLTQIGPNQTSVEYALSIESNLAAPSTYLFEISVSTHNVLAVQQELAVTVTL